MSHTDGVVGAESEFEAIDLVHIERVVVENFDIHLPLFEIVRRGYADAWWEVFVNLCGSFSWS